MDALWGFVKEVLGAMVFFIFVYLCFTRGTRNGG